MRSSLPSPPPPQCVRPLRTVYRHLEERNALALLSDPLLVVATAEIPSADRPRHEIQASKGERERRRTIFIDRASQFLFDFTYVFPCALRLSLSVSSRGPSAYRVAPDSRTRTLRFLPLPFFVGSELDSVSRCSLSPPYRPTLSARSGPARSSPESTNPPACPRRSYLPASTRSGTKTRTCGSTATPATR